MASVPYFMQTDTTTDRVPAQNLDPNNGFGIQAASNLRTVNGCEVSDQTVTHRGSKNIIWSSEGVAALGLAAIGANAKKANGNSGAIDLSPYKNLVLLIYAPAPTGGASPSLQFEVDLLDDTASPNTLTLPVWKPTAITAANNFYASIGQNVPFVQAASAPGTAPGSVTALAVPSGWTYGLVPVVLGPNGQFAWTVTGTPSGWAWTAYLYGIN